MCSLHQELLFWSGHTHQSSWPWLVSNMLIGPYKALLLYWLHKTQKAVFRWLSPSTTIYSLKITKCTHQRERIPPTRSEQSRRGGGAGSLYNSMYGVFQQRPASHWKTLPSGSYMVNSVFYCGGLWMSPLRWSSCCKNFFQSFFFRHSHCSCYTWASVKLDGYNLSSKWRNHALRRMRPVMDI